MTRYIDTTNKNEWSPNFAGDVPGAGALPAPDDHPFFAGFDRKTHYLQWAEGQLPELVAYTADEILHRVQSAAQEEINAQALQYLASTDWYVIRCQETGTPIPADVLAERQAARARVVK
jgi:hypothetical protein